VASFQRTALLACEKAAVRVIAPLRQRAPKEKVYEQEDNTVFVFYPCSTTTASSFLITVPALFHYAEYKHRLLGGIYALP